MMSSGGHRPFVAGMLVLFAAVVASAANAASQPAIQDRVFHARQFGGFVPVGTVQDVITQADDWSTQSGIPVAQLKREGFVRGIWENMHWAARNWDALSCVAQFRTDAGAQAAIAAHSAAAGKGSPVKLSPFPVTGIPGARGFEAVGPSATGYNVEFTVGPFWYYVAYGFPTGAGQKAGTKGMVLAAARTLYARVRG